MAALKNTAAFASDLAERLDLPEDALLGKAKITVTAGKRALIENHHGILEYGKEQILVSTGRGRIRIVGSELKLLAMNGSELLISGKLNSVEWE